MRCRRAAAAATAEAARGAEGAEGAGGGAVTTSTTTTTATARGKAKGKVAARSGGIGFGVKGTAGSILLAFLAAVSFRGMPHSRKYKHLLLYEYF